jgi:hypothetical protein
MLVPVDQRDSKYILSMICRYVYDRKVYDTPSAPRWTSHPTALVISLAPSNYCKAVKKRQCYES